MAWKWIFLGVFGFAVLFFVAVYVILSTYNFNSLKPQITRAAKQATGRELTLRGDIRLKVGLTPTLIVDDAGFQNAAWGSRPEMAKIKRFEMKVALLPLLSKRIELRRVILVEPDILIETDKRGRSNLDFGTAGRGSSDKTKETSPGSEMKLPFLLVNEFEITKGLVSFRDARTSETKSVALEKLTLSAEDPGSPTKLKMKASYNGQPVEAEGTVGPLRGLMASGKPWPLNVSGKAFDAGFTLAGTIDDVSAVRGINLRFTLKGSDFAKLGSDAGKPLPIGGPFDISGRVNDPVPATYRISDFKAVLGKSDLAGTVEAQTGRERPKVKASLLSGSLDVKSMFPAAATSDAKSEKGTKKPGGGPRGRRLFPDDPLPLDGLRAADAAIKIKAAQILLPSLSLSDVTADIDLTDGNLSINQFRAGTSGGTLEAKLEIQPQGKSARLTAVIHVEELDVGRFLKETKGLRPVDGRLNIDLSVKGKGASIAAIMATLDGKSTMTMTEGKIDNKYLNALGGDVASTFLRVIGVSGNTSSTTIQCLVSGFKIKDGRAETTALVADTGQASAIGEGEINLKNETLDMKLNLVPKGLAATNRSGRVASSIAETAQAFKVSGTLTRPSLVLDTTQTAISIGRMFGAGDLLGAAGLDRSSEAGMAGQKLCPLALEAARKGVRLADVKKQERKAQSSPIPQAPVEQFGDLGKGVQKFFGK